MAISSMTVAAGVSSPVTPSAKFDIPMGVQLKSYNNRVAGLGAISLSFRNDQWLRRPSKTLSWSHKRQLTHVTRLRSEVFVCSAALNARCGAEGQTQTVENPVSVIQNAPGKEKSPQLDDGGTGLPPRDDGDGGGGGGGGGGNFSGGFFFFGFLAFLGFLKDRESEGDYRDSR